jgi:hypothetical protein
MANFISVCHKNLSDA